MKVYAALAILGAVLIAVGFGLWRVEVGLVVGGLELVATAYVGAYMARRMESTE